MTPNQKETEEIVDRITEGYHGVDRRELRDRCYEAINQERAKTIKSIEVIKEVREALEYCKQISKSIENNSLEPDKVIALAGQISYRSSVALSQTQTPDISGLVEAEKAVAFVKHIEGHLTEGQFVICKICGKGIHEIS